jgi:hypothetical protein
MFERPLRAAKDRICQILTDRAGWVQTMRELFRSEDDYETRGLKLLREWLSPEQLAQYDANRYFDVTGCDTGKQYRIRHGVSMNIHEIDGRGHPRAGLCIVSVTFLAAGDVMLAQKIALETDELGTLAVARNFTLKKLGPICAFT